MTKDEGFDALLSEFYIDPRWREQDKMTYVLVIEFCRRAFNSGYQRGLQDFVNDPKSLVLMAIQEIERMVEITREKQ